MHKLFRKSLLEALSGWIEAHKNVIGQQWTSHLRKQVKRLEKKGPSDEAEVVATALWAFNTISQFGVMAGLGPNRVNLQSIPDNFDGEKTKELLKVCAGCVNLQYLVVTTSAH